MSEYGNVRLSLWFEGGEPPYTVEAYRLWYAYDITNLDVGLQTTNLLYSENTFPTAGGLYPYTISVPHYQEVLWYQDPHDMPTGQGGQMTFMVSMYYFVVRDQAGHICKTIPIGNADTFWDK